MSDFLRENCDQIKTIVVKTKGTPTQKLLAILIAAGVENTAELAELIGVQKRAIQKAKRPTGRVLQDGNELQDASLSSQTNSGTPVEKKVSPTPPSKNNYNLETTVQPEPASEPDGWAELKAEFNGSTAAMVADVQAYLAPYGDKASAVKWLGGTVSAFGPSRTAQAWTMIVAKVAHGEPIRNALPLWAKTAGGLRNDPAAAQAALENPFAEQTKGVKRHVQPAPDDPSYLANFGRRRPMEAARA